MDDMKVCSTCGKEFPRTIEYFGERKSNRDGFKGRCRTCDTNYHKEYHRNNKESVRATQNLYKEKNLSTITEYQKQYYVDNKEAINEQKKGYVELNKDAITEYKRRNYQENKEHIDKRNRQYKLGHPEQHRNTCQRRKAKKLNLPHTLTVEQWEAVKLYFNNKCAYCESTKPLTQDHFIPVIKDGEYSHNNIVPACNNCNCSKQKSSFFVWYPRQKFYTKSREEKILTFLNYDKNCQQQLSLA